MAGSIGAAPLVMMLKEGRDYTVHEDESIIEM